MAGMEIELTTNTEKNESSENKLTDVEDSTREVLLTGREAYLSMIRQILICCTVVVPTFASSFFIASTTFLPVILNPDSNLTAAESNEISVSVSLPVLVPIPATLLGFWLMKYYSLATLLRASLLGYIMLFFLMAIQPSYFVLISTRTVMQMISGANNCYRFSYLTELSEQRMRGLCGSLNELSISTGILFTYVTLTYITPRYAFLVNVTPYVLGLIGSIFVPESPLWLLRHEKYKEAYNAIAQVIGPKRREKIDEMYKEVLTRFKESEHTTSTLEQMMLLKKPKNWKPLGVMLLAFLLRELGGHSVIFMYLIQIFQSIGGTKESNTHFTIFVGISTVISTFIASIFQDKFGRRKVIFTTQAVCIFALSAATITSTIDSKSAEIFTLVAVLVFSFFSGIGMGPVPFILVGELSPCEVRFLNTIIALNGFYVSNFAIIYLLPLIIEFFGLVSILFTFAFFNIVGTVILYFTLKETTSKTLRELDNLYS